MAVAGNSQLSKVEPGLNLAGHSPFFRFILLASLFAIELVALSVWLDGGFVRQHSLAGSLISWSSPVLHTLVTSVSVFLLLACFRFRGRADLFPTDWPSVGRVLLGCHFLVMAVFGGLSTRVFAQSAAAPDVVAAAWLAAGLAGIGFGALAFVPLGAWIRLLRGTGRLWWYSLLTGIAASLLGRCVNALWEPVTAATFSTVSALLRPLFPGLVSDAGHPRDRHPRFQRDYRSRLFGPRRRGTHAGVRHYLDLVFPRRVPLSARFCC